MVRGIQKRLCFISLTAAVLACVWSGSASRAIAAAPPPNISFINGAWSGQFQGHGISGTLSANFQVTVKTSFTGSMQVSPLNLNYKIAGKVTGASVTMTGTAPGAAKLTLKGSVNASTHAMAGTFASGPQKGTFTLAPGGGGGGGTCEPIADGQGHSDIGAFETWHTDFLPPYTFTSPDGWTNASLYVDVPGQQLINSVSQTGGHTGQCVEMDIQTWHDSGGTPFTTAAYLISGPPDPDNPHSEGLGVPVSKRYKTIHFFLKNNLVGKDVSGVEAELWVGGKGGRMIAQGGRIDETQHSGWTEFNEQLLYFDASAVPDTAVIRVQLHGPLGQGGFVQPAHVGSVAWVDDICLGT